MIGLGEPIGKQRNNNKLTGPSTCCFLLQTHITGEMWRKPSATLWRKLRYYTKEHKLRPFSEIPQAEMDYPKENIHLVNQVNTRCNVSLMGQKLTNGSSKFQACTCFIRHATRNLAPYTGSTSDPMCPSSGWVTHNLVRRFFSKIASTHGTSFLRHGSCMQG